MADEPEAPFYYANVMEAHLGPFDVTLDFGFKKPENRPTTNYDKVCSIGMSLGHAKTMLPVLARLIAQYEQQFGAIPAPGYDDQAKE